MDDFDAHFERTSKLATGIFIVAAVIGLTGVAFLLWAGYTLVTHFTG
ncbi:MAG: hypothetical protein GWN53_17020 [Gammaproteobacteria bacterium]|uniref:Uncharacterized protein n=1 Tax=Candidatus Kutchimonas denitrificans TaxID=3056748 RepID=A0AAE4ZAQ1_9BACT|nr:hypothetical protein [Candidatus Kutchimonas denitrificans]NIV53543.1 hypothetical protein [Gammaproteobacteria bacterium]